MPSFFFVGVHAIVKDVLAAYALVAYALVAYALVAYALVEASSVYPSRSLSRLHF